MLKYKLIIFISVFSFCLFADDAHYKNVLIGDRAATMGGSFVAISDDSSGTYYNPAGLVYTSGTNISGSANVYHVQHTKYSGAIGSNDWERHSSELIPNFFSLIRKFGDISVGVSFVVPDSFVQHQDQVFTNLTGTTQDIDTFTLNLHNTDITDLIGPSVSYKLMDNLSVGLSLYYHFRKSRLQNYQLVEFSDNTDLMSYTNAELTEKGLLPKIGIMWSPIKPISLGLTVSKTFLFSSKTLRYTNTKLVTSDDITLETTAYNYKRPTATQISFGTAYFASPFLLFSADVDYYYIKILNKVMNFSLGSEYFFNEHHAVRGGFFTNLSCKPQPTSQTQGLEKINLYGFSVGYSLYQKATAITLGLIYSLGSGDAQVYDDASNIIKFKRYSYTGVISASYGF